MIREFDQKIRQLEKKNAGAQGSQQANQSYESLPQLKYTQKTNDFKKVNNSMQLLATDKAGNHPERAQPPNRALQNSKQMSNTQYPQPDHNAQDPYLINKKYHSLASSPKNQNPGNTKNAYSPDQNEI